MQFVPIALFAVNTGGKSGVTEVGGRLLCFEDTINLKLCPYEVAAFGLV